MSKENHSSEAPADRPSVPSEGGEPLDAQAPREPEVGSSFESLSESGEEAAAEQAPAEAAPEGDFDSPSVEQPVAGEEPSDADEDDGVGEVSPFESGAADAEPIPGGADEPESPDGGGKQWYILKVASNREKSIRDGLERRVKMAGLEDYFDEIIVPMEEVAEFKGGKRRVTKRKLYPGYILVNMEINDDTWFVVRETPGIGDFTGAAGAPTPMDEHDVQRILRKPSEEEEGGPERIKTVIPFKAGDHVRVKEGYFENFEGDVEGIDETHGRVTVMINIFGRPTPVELEHWQVEMV